jgi:tRNA (guanosine-2'-O-)-methyltransferase
MGEGGSAIFQRHLHRFVQPAVSPPSVSPYPFTFGGRAFSPAEVIERLAPFVGEARQARIEAVVAARTVRVVPVLERVHDLGNVNAALRSAEGLGVGAAHLVALEGDAAEWVQSLDAEETGATTAAGATTVEGGTPARRQSQGADKWLDLHVWPDAATACDGLKAQGYRIAATHLAADAVPIAEVDFTVPTALVFGNERDGTSDALLARADLNVVLPIDGFIQSYNISVAAALGLYHARADRIRRQGHHGDLSAEERAWLTARFYFRSVKAAEHILARYA